MENLYIPEAPGLGHSLGVADDEVGVLVFLGQSHGHRARVETLRLVWNMEINIICISNNGSNIYLARQRIKFKQIHQKKLQR